MQNPIANIPPLLLIWWNVKHLAHAGVKHTSAERADNRPPLAQEGARVPISSTDAQTIRDFSDQWNRFPDPHSTGYSGSKEYLADLLRPLLELEELKDAYVAEIGAGTGRIIRMLIESGARKALALEPSGSDGLLEHNLESYRDRVEIVPATGEQLPPRDFDYVFCVGVMQHISDPLPVLQAALRSLKPGGRYFMWLYAKEGTALYRSIIIPVRSVTRHLPDPVLNGLCRTLNFGLEAYISACARFRGLPASRYMKEVGGKISRQARIMGIYDQLNPAWVRYYSRNELENMMNAAGFTDVKTFHWNGYSWSVLGARPR
jgi:SAM-dependent methyltransferase